MTIMPGRSPSWTKSAASEAVVLMQLMPWLSDSCGPARRLPARSRNVATLTRFWQVSEQNRRLAFFETST